MNEDTLNQLSSRMTNLERDSTEKHIENVSRLTKIETILENAVYKLFGNGQAGILDKQDERIKRLETFVTKAGAIAGVLIILIEVLHEIPIKELLGLGK